MGRARKEEIIQVPKKIRFRAIKEVLDNEPKLNVKILCKISKVSRSGYYRYLSAPKSNRRLENEGLSEIIKMEFHALKGIYGARRIKILIERKYGKRYNLKRIKRLMRKLGLAASIRRKRKGC
ncbi:IS3 family transposase, partial [Ligilactobacillus animalis]|uniref:IS3 family transposase n=1 Tax=Ligilactobacillus animalis TaxID=1605 RepID=UPI003CE9FA8A